LLIACGLASVLALLLPDRLSDPVAGIVRRTVLAPLLGAQQRTESMRAAIAARGAALQTGAAAAEQALRAPALERENATLRGLLGLAGRVRSGFVIADAFHPTGVVDDFSLTIAAGASGGVTAYAPVVTADGLVGMIEAVDRTTSLAITWAHPDFRVSAVSADESAFGIVQPHLGQGADRYLLELRGVPFRASLDSGSLVVSSGLGGPYPRGIAIGTVISELPTIERWSRTYLLKPSVLPSSLSSVMVLLSSAPREQLLSAWTNVQAADSAMRAVVAASDSSARQAAMAELAARRAVMQAAADSARADSAMAGLGPAPGVQIPIVAPGGRPPAPVPGVRVPPPAVRADTGRRPPGAPR
jgi:rod shape-determining protein MreC